MDFGIGDVFDAVGDVAGDAWNLVESAGDLAGELAPVVGMFNPAIGLGLQSFSTASDFVEKFGMDQATQQRTDDTWGGKKGQGGGKGGCESTGGGAEVEGGFFQQLAILLGGSMDKTAGDLLDKAKDLQAAANSKDKENFFTISAEVQGLSQQLKVEGDTLSNVLQSTGNAADALVRKG